MQFRPTGRLRRGGRYPPAMTVLGTRVVRTEDRRLLTEGGMYVPDLRDPLLNGALFVTYVRSTIAHGTFTVDVSEASSAPGVVAVFTGDDVDLDPIPGSGNPAMSRPLLARERVRFVGEPMVAILSERPEQGVDAAESVWADYEPLPVVVDPVAARDGDVLLFPDVGTNVAAALAFGHSDDLFDGCEVVVTDTILNQRVAACPLECRNAAATWVDGRIHLWTSTQWAHGVRGNVADAFGLEPAQVRVIAPDV